MKFIAGETGGAKTVFTGSKFRISSGGGIDQFERVIREAFVPIANDFCDTAASGAAGNIHDIISSVRRFAEIGTITGSAAVGIKLRSGDELDEGAVGKDGKIHCGVAPFRRSSKETGETGTGVP